MKVEPGAFKLTGNDAKLAHRVVTKTIVKNWWVIAFYILINVGGVAGSYFLTVPWISAAAALGVAIVSTIVGYFMMSQAVTVTNEVR